MRKYKATVTFEIDVEADNCCAAKNFVQKMRLGGPLSSIQSTPSSEKTKRPQYWQASLVSDEAIVAVKLEASA